MEPPKNNWQDSLDGYLRAREPGRAEKSAAWRTAIGLQDVDGLKTSDYLLETAKAHIEGRVDIAAAQRRIESYYKVRGTRRAIEADTREADIVSARIAGLLGEPTFQFSPAELMGIHRRLFAGVFPHAGRLRNCNITKKEWVLDGETVLYASWDSLRQTLDYDFGLEKRFSYDGLTLPESIRHLAAFVSGIWQIHPFREGNTRTTAVFFLRYLRTFGFRVGNDAFATHSWFFRNALVRANYNNLAKGIHATDQFLVEFLENLLAGGTHDLKNRRLHVAFAGDGKVSLSATPEPLSAKSTPLSAIPGASKCQNGTLNGTLDCTLSEWAVLRAIAEAPNSTQKQLAAKVGKSERTIKRLTVSLQEKGCLRRENGRPKGRWEVLVPVPDGETGNE